MTVLRDSRVTLKLKKCSFFSAKLNYLRYVIRTRRLGLSEAAAAAVQRLIDSPTEIELKTFLVLCNVFC